jgi:hypothetical protein
MNVPDFVQATLHQVGRKDEYTVKSVLNYIRELERALVFKNKDDKSSANVATKTGKWCTHCNTGTHNTEKC